MAAAVVSTAPPSVHDAQHSRSDDPRSDLPRPYKCPLCEKAFHRLEHQTRHIRTHTGEKPHACQFPGCQKRFSRSDELTRHSRIHSNPNSRRGKAAGNVQAALAFAPQGHQPAPYHDTQHFLLATPQPPQYPATAPSSNLASPNVSPPQHYINYHTPAYQTPSSYGSFSRSGYDSPYPSQHPPSGPPERGINLLATAASQVEVERERQRQAAAATSHAYGAPPSSFHPHRPSRHHTAHHHPYSGTHSPARLPSLSAYAYSNNSNSMSRSSSTEGHAHDLFACKRSRPPSPQYTHPHSPNSSASGTPAETPSGSPSLRPEGGLQLPGLRTLSLKHGNHSHHSTNAVGNGRLTVPDTLEPTADINHNTSHTNLVNSSYGASAPGSRRASLAGSPVQSSAQMSRSANTSGMRIADIVNREGERTLPPPAPQGRRGVEWMLNPGDDRMDES